jgi:YD repeat-containing protein
MGIAVGRDGALYLADNRNSRIRRVGPDGIITTIAGNGTNVGYECACGPGNPPRQTPTGFPERIAIGPDGSVYFSLLSPRVQRLSGFLVGFNNAAFTVASEDGGEVYEFDANGRHLRTKDALTKRVLGTFNYRADGLLSSVTDADGNVTQLERAAGGALTAIIGPFGQRNSISLDSLGFLATLTNPAGETIRTQHDAFGRLTRLTDAKQNPPHQYAYDVRGRLTRDENPAGGFQTLSPQATDTTVVVPVTTGLNRVVTHSVQMLPDSSRIRLAIDPAGLVTRTTQAATGVTTVTSPDGSVATATESSDPRFGLQAPVTSQFSLRLPSGLQLSGSTSRRATLASVNDPLSLTAQTDSVVINGRSFKTLFDAVSRTFTRTSGEGRQTVHHVGHAGSCCRRAHGWCRPSALRIRSTRIPNDGDAGWARDAV